MRSPFGAPLLALALAGCGGGGGSASGTTNVTALATAGAPQVAVPGATGTTPLAVAVGAHAAQPAGVWLKGDLHSHSTPYSPDAVSQGGDPPAKCIALAEAAGLDFFALTDHRTTDQWKDPGYGSSRLTLIDGEEWGGPSHMGLLGLVRQEPEMNGGAPAPQLNPQVQAVVDDVHAQGGIAIVNHPAHTRQACWIWRTYDIDAVEVWNGYWAFPEFAPGRVDELDSKLRGHGMPQAGLDCMPELRDAVLRAQGPANDQCVTFWENLLLSGRRPAITGGGDRHMVVFPGMPTTHVFAKDRSQAAILDGIRKCRTWVGAEDGPQVDLEADGDGDGVFETIVGGDVPLGRAVDFRVRVRSAKGGLVDVVRDARQLIRWAVQDDDQTFTWRDSATTRAWWRVDVRERIDLGIPQARTFQVLSLAGAAFGQGGFQGLAAVSMPLGFTVTLGTRLPNVKLPREYARILNADWHNAWGYSRAAITSPIFAK